MAAPLTTGDDRPVTLYLVRHGAADGAAGRCIGHHDLALSVAGRADVAHLAARWPAPHPPCIVASDLQRAHASAAVLADGWGAATVAVDARLREMDFGAWEGRTWNDLQRDDAEALGAWMARWDEARVPNGEGFPDVIARAAAWLDDGIRATVAAGASDLVAVAHAGSIRALLVHALGVPRHLAFRLRVDHARVSALGVRGTSEGGVQGSAELLLLNATHVPPVRR